MDKKEEYHYFKCETGDECWLLQYKEHPAKVVFVGFVSREHDRVSSYDDDDRLGSIEEFNLIKRIY